MQQTDIFLLESLEDFLQSLLLRGIQYVFNYRFLIIQRGQTPDLYHVCLEHTFTNQGIEGRCRRSFVLHQLMFTDFLALFSKMIGKFQQPHQQIQLFGGFSQAIKQCMQGFFRLEILS